MIQIITTIDEVFCHILPMLDGLNELIKLSQFQLCFVCDLFLSMNLCQTYFYCWYNDPPYYLNINDVFHGYWNFLNIMSNVVLHELTPILNTSLEDLNFQVFGTSS
jgi:hypothetical protein